jgi:hypothetical protein
MQTVIVMCASCFQGLDPLMRDSLNAGILVLLGVTAAVLGCVALFFVHLARRARAASALPDAREGGVSTPPVRPTLVHVRAEGGMQ